MYAQKSEFVLLSPNAPPWTNSPPLPPQINVVYKLSQPCHSSCTTLMGGGGWGGEGE